MLTDQDKKEITSLFSNAFAQGVNELIAPGMSRMLEDMDDIKERLGNVEIRLGNVEIRLGQVETRVDSLEEIVESHSEQFSIMHLRRIPRACPWMNAILVTYKYLH